MWDFDTATSLMSSLAFESPESVESDSELVVYSEYPSKLGYVSFEMIGGVGLLRVLSYWLSNTTEHKPYNAGES